MSSRLSIFLFTLFAISILGCKSKKAVVVPTPAKVVVKPSSTEILIRNINNNENHFEYYSANGEADYKDTGTRQSFDLSIIMERDKYIWISITTLSIFEPFRIKMTPDSIMVIDRIHRQCMITDYSFLKKFAKIDLSLHALQQIIIGNPFFKNNEKQSIADTVLNNLIVYTLVESQRQAAFYSNNLKLTKNILSDRNINRQMIVEYSNPHIFGQNAFPSSMNINIRAEKNIECKLKLSNFVFEKKKEAAFSIPGSYEIIKP